jgi:hypothetical protein
MSEREAAQSRHNQSFNTGEIVTLEHLESGALLTVSEKKLKLCIENKTIHL